MRFLECFGCRADEHKVGPHHDSDSKLRPGDYICDRYSYPSGYESYLERSSEYPGASPTHHPSGDYGGIGGQYLKRHSTGATNHHTER